MHRLHPVLMEKRVVPYTDTGLQPAYDTIIQDRQAARNVHAPKTKEINIYTDGSGIDGKFGAAVVMRDRTGRWTILHYGLGIAMQHTVYKAELTGMILAIHMANSIENMCKLSIYTDNQAAILAL